MNEGDKLYIITRSDLNPGQQAVQCCHALRQFVAEHPLIDNEWFNNSNYLVLLSVSNLNELNEFYEMTLMNEIPMSSFREPDLNNELTAITLAPSKLTVKLCKKLPKALN